MNRVFLYLTSAAALPLLADASLKGAALLLLAGVVALLMRRSSAAARHMVWLAAVVALLLVPVLAVVLPGWRVLPQWAVVEAAAPPAREYRPHEAYRPYEPYTPAPHAAPDTLPAPASIAPLEPLPPTVASVPAPLPPAAAPPVAAPAPPATSWLLPLWAAGCALLLMRLAAAHFLLRRNTRRCEPASGPLAAAFAAAQQESSLRQPVRLLMDNARSIPVVWGVFRPTLLLPAEAVTWDAAQLRSVLLHELAHLRRRDPLVQFLTQIACALHWFNPLVWLAAWRLHVERERACDDMVLASGVRPSTYAEHLLHIATQLSPARWTQACGLAMARKSSLEGRLLAVLSDKLNRRRLTRALTAAAILLSAAIAVPIAMLRASEEKANSDRPVTTHNSSPAKATRGRILSRDGVVLAESAADGSRNYPQKTLAAHLIGSAGTTGKSGRSGAEKAFDAALLKGEDVTLALDTRLQSAAEASLKAAGHQKAAIVLIDLQNGAIPAAVSLPSLDANLLVGKVDAAKFEGLMKDEGQPLLNRATTTYPPGTQFSLVTGLAALRSGQGDARFTCTGSTPAGAVMLRCAKHEGHGDCDLSAGLQQACNYYFFELAARVGMDQIASTAELLGFGKLPAFELEAASGHVPTAESWQKRMGSPLSKSQLMLAGIGQGDIQASPLQVAQMAGIIATNGQCGWAHLTAGKEATPVNPAAGGLTPGMFATIRQAMFDTVNSPEGSGMNAKSDRLKIAGKSSTVRLGKGLVCWFAGYAPADAPRYSISIVVEAEPSQPASGGKICAPIARTIFEAVLPPENYSPNAKEPEESPSVHGGAAITPATEAQLDWGERVNGLRGAIVIRPTVPGAEPGVFLAVQNVSDKPLRFADTIAAEGLRKMIVSDTKGILFALTSKEPSQTDVQLKPRAVVYLRLLEPTASAQKDVEPTMIEGLRKDPLQTWRAVLDIQNAPDGAWNGKLTTGETRGAITTDSPQPNNPKAQALYKLWQNSARLNGDIPGGLVSLLHDKVKEFIRNNEPDALGAPYAAKMKPLEPRFGEVRDWKPAELIALLDDIAAASTIPLETTLHHLNQNTLQHGQPLPAALEKADWGQPLESGLRMAYVLEPRAGEYHLGTEVKARILLHNTGREPVAFIAGSFHQPGHKAKLADGSELKLDATDWLTRSVPQAWRLAPGEYVELHTPGLGIGAQNKDRDDWSNVRAGSWILCGDGSEVTFLPGGIMLSGADSKLDGEPRPWWPEFITGRLNREAPVPADTKEREYLLYRVVRDLFGTAPSTTEGDAFAADKSPDALKNLAALLTKHTYGKQSQGMIQPGETKFRVLPPDPDAAKRVRVASNPGYYNLSDTLKFSVTRRPQGSRMINEASLIYIQQGKDNAITKVELPDGYNTWAAAQEPGTTVLWIKQKDLVRRYDFTDPAQIKETRPDGDVPTRVLEAMQPILAAPDESSASKDNPPPAATPEKKTATVAPQPRHEYAQSLFKSWQANARSDGKIPGALVGLLAGKVDEFIKGYTGAGQDAVKLKALRPKLDATHDWTPAEAVALLDEIATINIAPLGWAEMPMKFDGFRDIKAGEPLPKELESAAWGAPAENGLRAAWLLEPRAEQYAHGTVLKARVLFHNAGKAPVVFQTETWHQYDGHKALDAKGAEISVKATRYTGITPMATFRLAPGEYCEVTGHGLAIGAGEYKEDFSTGAVGAIIEAKDGDTVTLSHTVDASYGGWTRPDDPKDPAELRKKQIAERIAREAPLPYAAADRELLIRRVALDLTGVPPTPEEIAAFTADKSPDALANLTARLQNQPAVKHWSGKLPTGETKFRVLPADPDATDKPKTVAVKLSPESLIGAWRGTVNGEKLMLSFHRPPAEKDVQCDIYFGEATIGVPASFTIAEDGGSAAVVQQSAGGGMKFGTLHPDEAGKLKLELYGRQQGQQETMLTRNVEPPVSNEKKSSTQPNSGAQLDRAKLEGTWEGEKDGATVKVEFQWLSEHQQVRWEVKRPGSSIAAEMSVVMAPDGNSADFIFRKGLDFEATQGRVTPGEGGTLHLEIIPNPNVSDPGYPAVNGLVLTRNPDGLTAYQIMEMVTLGRPVLPTLKGVLRKDGAEVPFVLDVQESTVRMRFNNPDQIIHLETDREKFSLRQVAAGINQEVPASRYNEAIRGTDLTLEDFSRRYLYWPKKESKGEETIKTRRCYVVDLHNPERLGDYSVVRVFVHKESGGLMRMQGYDWNGKLIKSCAITAGMKIPDAHGREVMAVQSIEITRYIPGTKKVAGETKLILAKPDTE